MNPVKPLLYFALQIAVFLLVHYAGHAYGTSLPGHQRHDIAWGISLKMAFILFGIMAFVTAIVLHMVRSKAQQICIAVAAFVIFSMFWINGLYHEPYRTLLLLVSALAGFVAPVLLKQVWERRKNTIPSAGHR